MSLTLASVVIVSPAQTGSPQSNSWPPCTIITKLMPTSGSRIAGPDRAGRVDDANIGGATTSRKPAACAASRSWWTGLSSPTAFAYSLIFSLPDLVLERRVGLALGCFVDWHRRESSPCEHPPAGLMAALAVRLA